MKLCVNMSVSKSSLVLQFAKVPPSFQKLKENELLNGTSLITKQKSEVYEKHLESSNNLQNNKTTKKLNLIDASSCFQYNGIEYWAEVLKMQHNFIDTRSMLNDNRRGGYITITPVNTPPNIKFNESVCDLVTEFATQKSKASLGNSPTHMAFADDECLNETMKQDFNSIIASKKVKVPKLNDTTNKYPVDSCNSSYNYEKTSANSYLSICCLECHIPTRLNFLPDPLKDSIACIFVNMFLDIPDDYPMPKEWKGAFAVHIGSYRLMQNSIPDIHWTFVDSERTLFEKVSEFVQQWNPDILLGYEVQSLSWGYLIERGRYLDIDLVSQLSRIDNIDDVNKNSIDVRELFIPGRIILNTWRLARSELALYSYTLENVAFHVLHTRIPKFSFEVLTHWWNTESLAWKTAEYFLLRCKITLQILSTLNIFLQTAELARVFGISFYEVLSRGTQFRVESMMLRLLRRENMAAISPSIMQRAKMAAPEWIPLTLEPESGFYFDPVVVLDFQSLYPSIMIAYNYCYSTCLGKVASLGECQPFAFGASNIKQDPQYLSSIIDNINFSPCGVAFVQPCIRKGILSKMLEGLLETRVMVKNAMKINKENLLLKKILHSRQLGLKLIANVTFGYTSANFSGRMPCSEVGDSIVSKARETLERAISFVNQTSKWNARVIYGDTDSLFILLKGRSKREAFQIGQEIANEITQLNPKPIKLKFEKVYLPCMLQTKKRYAGYMYETIDQEKPTFDAKGVEIIRRDSCPAVGKILEKSLKLFFDNHYVDLVKDFAQHQFIKILQGRLCPRELTFSREYKGANGYKRGACAPPLALTRQWTRIDKRKEPQIGERVPYVIVYGAPGLPLIKLVQSPECLVVNPHLRLHSVFYITRAIIPALDRCFSMLGVNVGNWFQGLLHKHHVNSFVDIQQNSKIAQYFKNAVCQSCNGANSSEDNVLCNNCKNDKFPTSLVLSYKIKNCEQVLSHLGKICYACTAGQSLDNAKCISIDCSVLYRYTHAYNLAKDLGTLYKTLKDI